MKARFLIALMLAASCTGDRDPAPKSETHVTEPDSELDEALMGSLLQAKNFHHQARVFMSDGNLDEAIAAVRRIFSIEFPAGAPEAEDVRLDAHAMLAKLLLASGKPADAMKEVDAGIAEKTRDSFFLANLYTVKGEIFEAQAADLEGQPDQQKPLKQAAIEAYSKSIEINEPLQKKLYEGRP